jgi:uncharacterized membrane protein YcaP (DUF421 family)
MIKQFTVIELLGGVVGVVIFSFVVRPTPVLGALAVFLLAQATVRWLQMRGAGRGRRGY